MGSGDRFDPPKLSAGKIKEIIEEAHRRDVLRQQPQKGTLDIIMNGVETLFTLSPTDRGEFYFQLDPFSRFEVYARQDEGQPLLVGIYDVNFVKAGADLLKLGNGRRLELKFEHVPNNDFEVTQAQEITMDSEWQDIKVTMTHIPARTLLKGDDSLGQTR